MEERRDEDLEMQPMGAGGDGVERQQSSVGARYYPQTNGNTAEQPPSPATATHRSSSGRGSGRQSSSHPTSPTTHTEAIETEDQESTGEAEDVPLSPISPPRAQGAPPQVPQRFEVLHERWSRFRAGHPIFQIPGTWLAAGFSIALFVLTVLYAFSTTSLLRFHLSSISATNTVFVLRILSEATAFCMIGMIDGALERLQWMLLSTETGIKFLDYVALNQGTAKWGLINLIFLSKRKGGHRWSVARLFLVLLVPVLSIIILSKTTGELTFPSNRPFPVAAGVGDFNASWVIEVRDAVALQFETDINRFLSDPTTVFPTNPVIKGTTICPSNNPLMGTGACQASYFIAGSLGLVTPWPAMNETLAGETVYILHDVQGLQVDFAFAELGQDARFDGMKDCIVQGNNDAAVQFCVTKSEENVMYAKMLHCPIDLQASSSCFKDTTWQSSTGWITAMTPYRRRATVNYSRYNESILSISDLSPPDIVTSVQAADLLTVFNVTFAGNPSGFSSNTIGHQFIVYLSSKLTFAQLTSPSYFSAASNLRNLLALPLYYFTPLYFSPFVAAEGPLPNTMIKGVQKELYVTASLASPSYRVRVAPWTVWVYTFGGAFVLLSCLTVLVLGSLSWTAGRVPDTTMWPVVDFVVNCSDEKRGGDDGLIERLRMLHGKGSKEVKRALQDVKLHVRVPAVTQNDHGNGVSV